MIYLDEDDDAPHLSSRELDVLRRIALGRPSREVAVELGMTLRTVERHIEKARHKMRARNKVHTIAKAVLTGELVLKSAAPDVERRDIQSTFMFNNQRV